MRDILGRVPEGSWLMNSIEAAKEEGSNSNRTITLIFKLIFFGNGIHILVPHAMAELILLMFFYKDHSDIK